VLCGQETKIRCVIRINLIIVDPFLRVEAILIVQGSIMERDVFNKTLTVLRNSSDRSAGILAGVIVDERLAILLQAVIIETLPMDSSGFLFENNGAFGTIQNKALVAYAFGLLDVEEFRLVNLIRKIRNKCAHDIASDPAEDFSFSKSPLIDLLREWLPEKWINQIPKSKRQKFTEARMMITPDNARFFFDYLVSLVSVLLEARVISSNRRVPPPSLIDRADLGDGE
jgi:hypothetical protein